MNKKFSTLVAVLLAAGAWTTLDAKLVEVGAPQVGMSYLLGTSTTSTEVTNLVKDDGSVANSSATTVAAFGKEWTLEAIPSTTFFYLKGSDGKYVSEGASANATQLQSGSSTAIKFKFNGNKIQVAETTTGNGYNAEDQYLLANAAALETNTSAADIITIANVAEDELDLSNASIGQTVSLAKSVAFGKDVYYFIGADGINVMKCSDLNGTVASVGLSALTATDVDAALWKIERTDDNQGTISYKFVNKANPGVVAKIGGQTSFPISTTNEAMGVTLKISADQYVTNAFAVGAVGAAATFGIYNATLNTVAGQDLNALLRGGFNLSVKVTKDGSEVLKDASAFDGKLVAVLNTNGDALPASPAPTNPTFCIKSGDKFVVLNTQKANGDNGDGIFELVDAVNSSDYLAFFQVMQSTGYKATDLVAELHVAGASNMTGAKKAIVHRINNEYYLTAKSLASTGDALPFISLTSSNIASYKDFLGQFMNIAFVSDKVEEAATPQNIIYKKNGVLTTIQYPSQATQKADYADKSTLLLSSPEAQWAVKSVNLNAANNPMTLINRESQEEVTNVILRETSVKGQYYVESASVPNMVGDIINISFVKDPTKFDGFRTATVNELRNQVFHIGQYHNETGNTAGYWTENHQGQGTHQLGVISNEEYATNWTLKLDKKLKGAAELAEVDTVFIKTPMASINKNGELVNGDLMNKNAAYSELAILPYQFQNKSNLEYVRFEGATNLEFYVCNEVGDVRTADRFALKMKPNGTYNIVTLPNRADGARATELADDKIYVGNSDQWGSLRRLATYKTDDNSLMVVKPLDRPEYRKVKVAWGDTVKIYRQEYPTEVLFEKGDANAVVDGHTLSFLNVNNSVTGANPALFVDTAYVNRVDADGIANTCYQYLLAVDVDKENSYYCPHNPEHNTEEWRHEHGGPCADAMENVALKGRFLVNLIDTAYAYKQDHLHNNPYINMYEADENLAKLAFVEGIHVKDTLILTRKGGEPTKLAMDDPRFNVAKFAFRYVDNNAGSFKIQTQYKDYDAENFETFEKTAYNHEGYLRWVNGTVVVTNRYTNGETFNMEESYAGNPVANEDITASAISVVATDGGVIIRGAEGKKVVISNVLGQTVASAVISSDEATISAPAGVVVVAVEGETAVKAIVK